MHRSRCLTIPSMDPATRNKIVSFATFTLRDLSSRGGHQRLLADFKDGLNDFSPHVLAIQENFEFRDPLTSLFKAEGLLDGLRGQQEHA